MFGCSGFLLAPLHLHMIGEDDGDNGGGGGGAVFVMAMMAARMVGSELVLMGAGVVVMEQVVSERVSQ